MAAPTKSVEPTRAVIEQAATWRAQLADETCGEVCRAAFDAWLNAAPSHRLAFDRMGSIEERAFCQDPIERAALETMLSQRQRRAAPLALFLAGATALVWVAAQNPYIRSPIADERTAVGELKSATFAAGDRITLDSASAADFDRNDRSIRLWRGGVMAKVQPGRAQPFLIRTAHGTARALGTQFSVRIEGDATVVDVIESYVEICADEGNRSCLTLAPRQSARLDAGGASRLPNVDPVTAAAWSDGLLIADDRSLADVLNELNRYRNDPVRYVAADIEDLSVSGTFPLTDTDRALTSIGAALPVRIERTAEGTQVRRR